MEYKIIDFNEQLGRITVETEKFGDYQIDLPLSENNLVYEGTELHNYIVGFLPTYHVKRTANLARGILNAAKIKALVVPSIKPQQSIVEIIPQVVVDKLYILSILQEEGLI